MNNKVLIVPGNTDLNRGDQALTWESIEIAKSVFGKPEIYLYKANEENSNQSKINYQTSALGHKFLSRILLHPRRNQKNNVVKFTKLHLLKWGIRALLDTFLTLMLLSKFRLFNQISLTFLNKEQKETYFKYKELTAVFVKGGGFLHSYGKITDAYVMYFQLFDALLANRLGIKVYILPNSIGPLKNGLAKRIVTHVLKNASLVYVRESESQKFLKSIGIDSILSPDLGFYLKPSDIDFKTYLLERGVPIGTKKNIAITLRPYRFDGSNHPEALYNNYVVQFENIINSLLSKNFSVSLIAHTLGPSAHENDSIPLLEIYKKFEDSKDVLYLYDKNLTSKDVEKIYSYYDLVIGTRFHSVIFALNVNTPSIAIAYGGNKAVGIMNDLDLAQYVVPIENPDARRILELVTSVFENSSEIEKKIEAYRKVLFLERNKILNTIKKSLIN